MIAAAKEKMLSGFGPWCADLPLAAGVKLSGNSRQGFESKNAALHLGQSVCNSTTALGIERGLLESGIGSRIQTWNRYAYVANNPLSFVDPTGLLLKGPVSTCAPGDTIVCGSGGFEGGGDDSGSGGTGVGSGGLGSFCDASGNCSGIATCTGGSIDDNGNCQGGLLPNGVCQGTIDDKGVCQPGFVYVGGTTGFGAITLPGAIQFGAAAINGSYQAYLTGLASEIIPATKTSPEISIVTDPQYLAFLTNSAPVLSPVTPGVTAPLPKEPFNPCKFFPTSSCLHLPSPSPTSLQILTMPNPATPFGDFFP